MCENAANWNWLAAINIAKDYLDRYWMVGCLKTKTVFIYAWFIWFVAGWTAFLNSCLLSRGTAKVGAGNRTASGIAKVQVHKKLIAQYYTVGRAEVIKLTQRRRIHFKKGSLFATTWVKLSGASATLGLTFRNWKTNSDLFLGQLCLSHR